MVTHDPDQTHRAEHEAILLIYPLYAVVRGAGFALPAPNTLSSATQDVIEAIADAGATQHIAATVATPGLHRDAPAPEEVGKGE